MPLPFSVVGLGCKCGIGKGNNLHLYPDSSYPSLIAVMVVSSLASLRPLGRKKTPLRVSLQITMREVARWNIVTPAPGGNVRLVFGVLCLCVSRPEVVQGICIFVEGRDIERWSLTHYQTVAREILVHRGTGLNLS